MAAISKKSDLEMESVEIQNELSEENILNNKPPVVPPLDIQNTKTSQHLPFVYFVVAENKMPVQVSLLEGNSQSCSHAIKVRKKFLQEKKRQEKHQQETKKMIQHQNSMLGLCLGPVKDKEGNVTTSLTKNIYPDYKLSKNYQPRVKSEAKRTTRISGSCDYNMDAESVIESVKKSNSIINLELSVKDGKTKPIRIPSASDYTEDKDAPKQVQFSECSFYKDEAAAGSQRAKSQQSVHGEHPTGKHTTTSMLQSGNKYEMALPKIDPLCEMYDDVILKAIDTYMTSRNVSAKRRPEMERQLISRLAMTRKYQMEVDAKIRESSATTTRSRMSAHDGALSDTEGNTSRRSYKQAPIKQTAFQMAAPGTHIH